MKQRLTTALLQTGLILASLLSAQAAMASKSAPAPQPAEPAALTAPQTIVIAWDRVGDKLKGWV